MRSIDVTVRIRRASKKDRNDVLQFVRDSLPSMTGTIFVNTLFKEVLYEAIVLLSAFLFIFVDVPLLKSFISVPIVFIGAYFLIYFNTYAKIMQSLQNKTHIESWVAEVNDSFTFLLNPNQCNLRFENEDSKNRLDFESGHESSLKTHIIGFCAVYKHYQIRNSVWFSNFFVHKKYQKRGVGRALVQEAVNFSKKEHFDLIELSTTECEDHVRSLFLKFDFDTKQCYHKKFAFGLLSIVVYQLRLCFQDDCV